MKIGMDPSSLRSLDNTNWLDGETIVCYLNLLAKRSERFQWPRMYVFDSFFLVELMRKAEYVPPRRRSVDISSYRILFVPIHVSGNHWCIAKIDREELSIDYYDPYHEPNHVVLGVLLGFLNSVADKEGREFHTNAWTLNNVNGPRQPAENESDCGVFCCMWAECYARDIENPPTFTVRDMPEFRKRIKYDICRGQIDP